MAGQRLETLVVEGFKSIRQQTLKLGALNVLIGGNGAGKSNLIEVFRFLREIIDGNLAAYTAKKGGADSLLYFGRKTSQNIKFHLEFSVDPSARNSNAYMIDLRPNDQDNLFVGLEVAYYHDRKGYKHPYSRTIAQFVPEALLGKDSHITARQVTADLRGYRVYHFHDTSDTAGVKGTSDLDDNRFLRAQAENLPAFLYYLQQRNPDHFANIESAIRLVAPFFDSFQLEPSRLNPEKIRLEWREKGHDTYFSASSLSDGTLRFICLATLLFQPNPPPVILLDEPELGLHPASIGILAGMLQAASEKTQVIAATQSVTLVNQLELDQLWAVDRENDQSVFRPLRDADMSAWLDNYSVGDLWEKNLLGARP